MKRILRFLAGLFRLGVNTTSFTSGVVFPVPAGIVADNVGDFGLFGLMQNLNQCGGLTAVAGGTATTINLTAAQFLSNVIDYSGSPGGGVTMNTPTAAAIIAAFPNTLPPQFPYLLFVVNDSAGQTATVTGGTGVTVTGTATVATATTRVFYVYIDKNAATVNLVNMGGWNL